MRVRPARDADRPALHALGEAMRAELAPHLTYSPERVDRLIDSHLLDEWPVIFVVCGEDDLPAGFLVAQRQEQLATTGFFIAQALFYVRPDKRGRTRAAAILFTAFLRWAKSLNPEEIYAGIGAGENALAAARWLRRFGLESSGQQIMRLKVGGK